MVPVNIESLEKLVEEETRFNELTHNFNESSEAKQILVKAIADIDKVIINRLVNIVNDEILHLMKFLQQMMGGGKAELYWTDPNDILESGIEIKAQHQEKHC